MPGIFSGALFERSTLQNNSCEISICKDVLSVVYSLLPEEGKFLSVHRSFQTGKVTWTIFKFLRLCCARCWFGLPACVRGRAAGFKGSPAQETLGGWSFRASQGQLSSTKYRSCLQLLVSYSRYIWYCCAHSWGVFLLFYSRNAVFVLTRHLDCLESLKMTFCQNIFSLWANKLRHFV